MLWSWQWLLFGAFDDIQLANVVRLMSIVQRVQWRRGWMSQDINVNWCHMGNLYNVCVGAAIQCLDSFKKAVLWCCLWQQAFHLICAFLCRMSAKLKSRLWILRVDCPATCTNFMRPLLDVQCLTVAECLTWQWLVCKDGNVQIARNNRCKLH